MTTRTTSNVSALPTSCLWHALLVKNKIPRDGVVVEVAPGYEPKIGAALAAFGFTGTVFVIEPDAAAARHIQKIYRKILPCAVVTVRVKPLEAIRVGTDIPTVADAVMASHPFDDMVMNCIVNKSDFFSREKESGALGSPALKRTYEKMADRDYARGVARTVVAWEKFIKAAKPRYVLASQYPSRTLTVKNLTKRQESGYAVLDHLKYIYQKSLVPHTRESSFGYKGNPRWWFIAKNPCNTYRTNSADIPVP